MFLYDLWAYRELLEVQAGFRRDRGTRDQIANMCWIMEKARELPELGMPDEFIDLLRNLYVGHEATVRIGYGTTDWFKIGKGV